MQRGRVGGIESICAAIHVSERLYNSSTNPDDYKSHTHSDNVSLSHWVRICRARKQVAKKVFDEPPKDVVATFKIKFQQSYLD